MDLSQQILSEITVFTKYAQYLPDKNRRETWNEIIDRNKQMHLRKYPHIAQEIESAYNFVYDKKILPSMRSLQLGGKPIEVNPARIYNCSYLPIDDWRAFSEVMFLLLSGSGVGFSVQKHHIGNLPEIKKPNPNRLRRFLIGDSIEGWADAVRALMKSYFQGGSTIVFDFRSIRPKGSPLSSGGKAPGPQPLKECLVKVEGILSSKDNGTKLSSIETHDIICHIADAVLAGGIRRAALISLFNIDDEEMLSAKSGSWWELNPQRGRANNSAVLLRHKITNKDFVGLWERIKNSGSGEPGIWFSNDKDWGCNPCNEISLRPFQFCNLVEVNVSNLQSQQDFNERVKAASLIATLQAGYTDFHYLRTIWKRVTEKDALIGVSMTGIASMEVFKHDIEQAVDVIRAENKRVAQLIGINPAARLTCVKPAGTTSLTLGTSSGIHAWHDDFYIRRIRVMKNESIYQYLSLYYPELIKDEIFRPHDTAVVELPQRAPSGAVTRSESAIDLLERIKQISQRWIKPGHIHGSNTHNVSATVTIKENEWDTVCEWMWNNRDHYNGLSVLPHDGGSYVQAPFESISHSQYEQLFNQLKSIDLSKVSEDGDYTELADQLACAGGVCEIV